MARWLNRVSWRQTVLLGLALVFLQLLFLEHVLHFDLVRSDAAAYWRDSLNWREPYNSFHVPAYPLAIAGVRAVLGVLLQPAGVLLATILPAFVVALIATRRLGGWRAAPQNQAGVGLLAAGLFALWPMVGLTYVTFPIADMFGMAPALLGLWFLLKRRHFYGGLCFGVALVAHKAVWPVSVLLLLAHVGVNRSWKSLIAVAVALVPLGALWVAGAEHHGSFRWILASNLSVEIQPHSALPILDGALGSILRGQYNDIVKGFVVLAEGALAGLIAWRAWRQPAGDPTRWYGLAIAGAILGWIVILNQHEIWASVRFGRMLAIPLAWFYGEQALNWIRARRWAEWAALGGFGLLLLSQFGFAYYMARVFFPQFN